MSAQCRHRGDLASKDTHRPYRVNLFIRHRPPPYHQVRGGGGEVGASMDVLARFARNPEPQTPNPEPKIQNPEPSILYPEP